jgi:HEPN domain-containing protein
MKKPKQQAERWLRQTEHDLMIAQTHFQNTCYSDCCFMSEQASQKAMKAFLYAQGERVIVEHSIAGMMRRAAGCDPSFQPFLEKAGVLDQYYIPTRYPDALADPAVPFESYTREQASQALAFAREIVELVKQKVG